MAEPFSMRSGVTGQKGAFYQKYNPFPSRPCPQYLVLFLKDPEPASASCAGLFLNTFPKADHTAIYVSKGVLRGWLFDKGGTWTEQFLDWVAHVHLWNGKRRDEAHRLGPQRQQPVVLPAAIF